MLEVHWNRTIRSHHYSQAFRLVPTADRFPILHLRWNGGALIQPSVANSGPRADASSDHLRERIERRNELLIGTLPDEPCSAARRHSGICKAPTLSRDSVFLCSFNEKNL
jgi:hypothetical protein